MALKANLSSLTAEQQADYAKVNALLGLGPDECTYIHDPESHSVLSSDPTESHVQPHFVAVGSIAELRKVAGYDDIHPKAAERDEDEVHYPMALTMEEGNLMNAQPSAMKLAVNDDLQQRIQKAATAYVMLNKDRVADYEPLINATMFPGKVAVFAAPELVVPDGKVLTLTGPEGSVFNYGTVTVGKGATIDVDINCTFNCQVFTQL